MATANRSGDPSRAEDEDPDRTQRVPGVQEVVDRWFPSDEPTQMDNRTARPMERQLARGERTAGRRGCPLAGALAVAVVALGATLLAPDFDWPCACGHTSDKCTKRADGTCDG